MLADEVKVQSEAEEVIEVIDRAPAKEGAVTLDGCTRMASWDMVGLEKKAPLIAAAIKKQAT